MVDSFVPDEKSMFKGVVYLENAIYGDLYYFIRTKGHCVNLGAYVAKNILLTLQYVENMFNLSHRDLKPENVVIDEHGVLKLIDWELCSFSTESRSSVGTLSYMAPELLTRGAYICWKADIWSLGVLVFSTCVGYRPYHDPPTRAVDRNDTRWKDAYLNLILKSDWVKYWRHVNTNINSDAFKIFIQNTICIQEKRLKYLKLLNCEFVEKSNYTRIDLLNALKK
jgi:serine/threonine protein kinase